MNIKLPHNHQEDETALEQLPSLENCQMTADVFRQLGDETGSGSSGFSATAKSAS